MRVLIFAGVLSGLLFACRCQGAAERPYRNRHEDAAQCISFCAANHLEVATWTGTPYAEGLCTCKARTEPCH